MSVDVRHGDCMVIMGSLADNSIDSIVTDPPYDLTSGKNSAGGFMGKAWDGTGIAFDPATWRECLRVLKPGGHLLSFGGTRTSHRMAVAIEDAGFEIRDSIAWLYGSGFPKSLDVGKAIDKGQGLTTDRAREFQQWLRQYLSPQQVDAATGTFMGSHLTTHPTQPAIATADLFDLLRPLLPDVPERIERLIAERTGLSWVDYQARPVTQKQSAPLRSGETITFDQRSSSERERRDIPATDDARKWQGWGTAMKPGYENIVCARKPLSEKTVAANVLTHGTGGLNIDATRIGGNVEEMRGRSGTSEIPGGNTSSYRAHNAAGGVWEPAPSGRWPANVILDEDQAAVLDEQSGTSKSTDRPRKNTAEAHNRTVSMGKSSGDWTTGGHNDTGGASRFFLIVPNDAPFKYQAKAPAKERPSYITDDGRKISHPTTKPLALMRWLIRLITPPGGTILDPFAGSGTTLEAALLEGFDAIGIESEADYIPLIHARLDRNTP